MIKILENFSLINEWICTLLFFHRKILKQFLIPFALCIYLELLKNKHVLESSLFLLRYGFEYIKPSFYKIKKKKFRIKKNLKSFYKISGKKVRKFFKVKTNIYAFEKLIFFLETHQLQFFLKCIDQKFFINYRKKFYLGFKNKKLENPKRFLKNHDKLPKRHNFFDKTNLLRKNQIKPCINIKSLEINFNQKRNALNCLDISLDETQIAAGSQNGSLEIFNLNKNFENYKRIIFNGHPSGIFSTKFSKCQRFVLSGGFKGELLLWSLEKKKILRKYQTCRNPIWDIAFSKENNIFSTANEDTTISMWNPEREFPIRSFRGHLLDVNVIRWHPCENYLISGSSDHSIRIWDTRMAKSVGFYKSYDKSVYSLDISPNGNEITFGGSSCFIDTWDIRKGKLLKRIKENSKVSFVNNIIYSKNRNYLAYLTNLNMIKIWTKEQLHSSNQGVVNILNKFPQTIEKKNFKIMNFKFSSANYGIVAGLNI